MGTSLKGRNLLPEGMYSSNSSLKGNNLLPEVANSFLYEQLLKVWQINFITLSLTSFYGASVLHCLITECTFKI